MKIANSKYLDNIIFIQRFINRLKEDKIGTNIYVLPVLNLNMPVS